MEKTKVNSKLNKDSLKAEKVAYARELCVKVKSLCKEYDMPFFFITDGASIYSNNGNEAIKNARDAQIIWEKNHGFDYKEDWGEE